MSENWTYSFCIQGGNSLILRGNEIVHWYVFLLDPGACRDKVSMCYTYDPIICVVYRSWAEVQCACFCKTHNHGTVSVNCAARQKINEFNWLKKILSKRLLFLRIECSPYFNNIVAADDKDTTSRDTNNDKNTTFLDAVNVTISRDQFGAFLHLLFYLWRLSDVSMQVICNRVCQHMYDTIQRRKVRVQMHHGKLNNYHQDFAFLSSKWKEPLFAQNWVCVSCWNAGKGINFVWKKISIRGFWD